MKKYIKTLMLILVLSFGGCTNITDMMSSVFSKKETVAYEDLQFRDKIAYYVVDREATEKDNPFTGYAVSVYPESKSKKYEVSFRNGKLHGDGKKFFESGPIMAELKFKNGKKEGIEKSYYESGGLLSQVEFKDGLEEGPAKSYYESQKLKSETQFVNGIKNGDAKSYYENGQVKYEITYKNGIRQDLGKLYYENGAIAQIETYKNGELHDITRYDELGNKVVE